MSKSGPRALEVTSRDAGTRLDRFLRRTFPSLPQARVQKLLRNKAITVNRRRAEARTRVQSEDLVEVHADLSAFEAIPEHRREAARRVTGSGGFRRHFRILHEDDSLLVLDKPGGLVVHPGPRHYRGDTLLDLLRAYLAERSPAEAHFRPGFVHRLDRGTSGVIVAAKTQAAAVFCEGVFRRGEARKTYLALVSGHPEQDSGTVDVALRRGSPVGEPARYAPDSGSSDAASPDARAAVTRYRVERRFQRTTLLRLEPETGRTHQIRVHLASRGWPIIGDGDYGNKALNRRYREQSGLTRTFLHASRLELPHPTETRILVLEAPLPEDLERVFSDL